MLNAKIEVGILTVKHSKYSVIIVGSGIAGLYAALKLSDQMNLPDGLLVLTKANLADCNSSHAQGGIVAVLPENSLDSVKIHVEDTLKAGAGLSDEKVVTFISENSNVVIKDLLEYGVEFDKNEKNEFNFTLEGAHSVKRILHAGGDSTGANMEKALVKKVLENPNITVYEQALAVELIKNQNGKVKGLICYKSGLDEYEVVYSAATVFATGGIGQVYKYTTNPEVATGDGMALAYRAGAIISDMEFVQFHPTALSLPNDDSRFLISEAVRGEGAKLVNSKGEPFMHKYHSLADLAPRDIVTRSIFAELKSSGELNAYLDATGIGKEKLLKRFPNIYKLCLEKGIDITKDYIPVSPACHYLMGGIKTNITNAKTSLDGLYSIGEVACTGLHGANRLASNSLLECVVSAYELADYLSFANLEIPEMIDESILETIRLYENEDEYHDIDVAKIKAELQQTMWDLVGVERNEVDMLKALDTINRLQKEFKYTNKCSNFKEYELRNLLCVSKIITSMALARQESRGGHYRNDYPNTMLEGRHSSLVKEDEINDKVFTS